MDKSKKTVWICEECGREFAKLPFPASCECGNYCEEFFRLKDIHDYEDEKLGRPLLGVKYAPEVLEARGNKLQEQGTLISQDIEEDEKAPTIDFSSMKKAQLLEFLQSAKSPLANRLSKKAVLVHACESLGKEE